MSTTFEQGLIFTDNDQSSINEAINVKLKDMAAASDGLESFRIPTLEDLKYVKITWKKLMPILKN